MKNKDTNEIFIYLTHVSLENEDNRIIVTSGWTKETTLTTPEMIHCDVIRIREDHWIRHGCLNLAKRLTLKARFFSASVGKGTGDAAGI
jgi:hypothetical protein